MSDLHTTSREWVDIPDLRLEVDTASDCVFTSMLLYVSCPQSVVTFRILMDGEVHGFDPAHGILTVARVVDCPTSYQYTFDGVTPGRHVFQWQWRVEGQSATIRMGDGKSYHPQIYVRDIGELIK